MNPLTPPKITTPSVPGSDSLATTCNSPKALETNEVEVFTQSTTPMPSPSPKSWLTNDADGESVNIETPSQASSTSSMNYALSTHEVYENLDSPSDISSVSHVHLPLSAASSKKKTFKIDKGKKRLAHKERWLVVQRKLKKNSGEEFVNKKGKVVESKQLKDPCTDKCRLKCTQKMSYEDRKRVFKYFWLLGEKKKHWEFVIKNTKKILKRRQTTEVTKHNRQNTYQYFLPDAEKKPVKVCKTMFLNTIALSERVVSTAWKKFDGNTVIEDDKRGRYEHEKPVYNDEMVKSVCDHVRCFPVVEAHYVRKNSCKLYLEGIESISRMYKLYCEWFDSTKYYSKATTKRQYREVVNANFNLALHRPKKDKCDTCHVFENKLTKTDEEKAAFDLHQHRKNRARELKKSDKQEAEVNKDVVTATFDFQKVLVTPYGEISVLYYKRRFTTLNFTVYDLASKIGTCYMWHEVIARRGSIEVSSCILNFIKFHAARGVKEFRFWSDNCAGQNRNRIVFSLYMFVAKKLGVTVTHRFLEKGHTQNEGDSVHATVERNSKHKTIWVPEEWYCLVRWAKSEGDPYVVKKIRQEDIFDFKALLVNKNWTKNTKNEKVSWNSIREVKVSAAQNDRIEYKYDFDEEPKTIVVLRSGTRNKKRMDNILELNQAYQGPLPISKEKYKDITDLCRGGIIPECYHDFYLNLPHTNASNLTRDESDSEDD